MSKHLDSTVAVDADSRATTYHHPKHRGDQTDEEIQADLHEDIAFMSWCKTNDLDPEDGESATAYEGEVGWLYIAEPQEDHR